MIATRKAMGPRLCRLEAAAREASRADAGALERLRLDPTGVMTAAGQTPDPWQEQVLRSDADRLLLLCGRQCFDADTVVLTRDGRAMRICDHPDAWFTGVRPVRRYTLRGGAALTVTDNHPVFTAAGWAPAGALKVGDRVAALSCWDRWPGIEALDGYVEHGRADSPRPAHVSFPVTEGLGRLIGYLMTDGSNRPGQSIKFTDTRREYLDEVERLVASIAGVRAKHYAKGRGEDLLFTTTKARHDNRLMDLMRVLRWDERFPTDLFRFPAPVAAAAVNRAWSGDGCVRTNTGNRAEVFLACKNEVYGRYLQLLLMKLGVQSRLTSEWHARSTKPFHRLILNSGRLNVERFFGAAGPIFGKEEQSARVLAAVRGTSKVQDYRKTDHVGEDGEVLHLAPVVKVEELGERPVWDVSVPGKEWLVAQGVKAHNCGKSSVSAALALSTALVTPRSPVLLLSPSDRQSGELFRKVVDLYDALGRPLPAESRTARRLELANGSRVLSLPGTEKTLRGFSGVGLLVIDEAARVDDGLYYAVRPMLAVSGGRLVALSTPYGKRGWFHDEWFGEGQWERVRVTAEQCPRISRAFLDEERRALGERWFAQEYLTRFAECIDAVFSYADIQAARTSDIQPLFPVAPGGGP